MTERVAVEVAERLLRPVFGSRPFEGPLRKAQREAAQEKVEELQADPRGAGLTAEQAARRADLMAWLEKCRASAAMLQKEGLRVFYRSRFRREPWSVGVFLDFDTRGFRVRLRTLPKKRGGEEGEEGRIVVLDPEKFQLATELERQQLVLRARIRGAEERAAALLAELQKLRVMQQELDGRLGDLQTPVSAPLREAP